MKKLMTAFSSILLASAVSFAEDVNVLSTASWEAGSDGTISSASLGDSSETSVAAALTYVESADINATSYAYLGAYVAGNLGTVTAIEVSYSSNKDFAITLGDTASNYGYSKSLVAGATQTVKFNVPADLALAWGEGSLNLDEVFGVSFDAVDTGATNLEVTALTLFGYTIPVEDTTDTTDTTTIDTTDTTGTDTTSGELTWEISTDSLSSGVISDSSDTSISAALTLGANSWVGLAGYSDSSFTGINSIVLTYTSDKPIGFSLGADTYGYTAYLEAGTDVTVTLAIPADFEFSWSESGDTTALNLGEIFGFSFDATEDGVTNITVKSVEMSNDEVATATTPVAKSSLAVTSFVNSAMNLTVPAAGTYEIGIYSIDGRLLKTMNTKCTAGINTVDFAGFNLANRMVVVQISGNNQSLVTKAVLK